MYNNVNKSAVVVFVCFQLWLQDSIAIKETNNDPKLNMNLTDQIVHKALNL